MDPGLTRTNMKPRNRKAGPGKKERWNAEMETGSAKHGSRKFDSMKPEVGRKHRTRKSENKVPEIKTWRGPEARHICDPKSEKHETRK